MLRRTDTPSSAQRCARKDRRAGSEVTEHTRQAATSSTRPLAASRRDRFCDALPKCFYWYLT